MSQEDIRNYLLNKRLGGDNNFFTSKQIRDQLKEGKNNLHKNLNKLYLYGIIELETTLDRDLQYGTKYRFVRELIFPRRLFMLKIIIGCLYNSSASFVLFIQYTFPIP